MKPSLSLDLVQGVGDTFWVWQKLYHHVESLKFNVMVTDPNSVVQRRAVDWLKLLPKVESVVARQVPQVDYSRVAATRYDIRQILSGEIAQYAVNLPLEEGVRLEAIDPGFEVEWGALFDIGPATVPAYSLLYVSGSKPDKTAVWNPREWAQFYSKIWNGKPCLLFGAPYDDVMLHAVAEELKQLKIYAGLESCVPAAEACRFLRSASQFVGYQSGLGIVADAYDVPQVMIDWEWLKPMKYSWCKPGHAKKLFFAGTFDQTPDAVLAEIQTLR